MGAFKYPTHLATLEEMERMNSGVRRFAASGRVLITPVEKRFTHQKIVFNTVEELWVNLAKNGEEIAGLAMYGDRIKVRSTLHNNYSPTLAGLPVRGCTPKGIPIFIRIYSTMNAASVLEAVIEYIFIAAVPELAEREHICRQIMLCYRERPIWAGKTCPRDRTRKARVKALPKLSRLNFYRAKQIWVQIHLDPEPFTNYGRLPTCVEIYNALQTGKTFYHLLKKIEKPTGRPRGATSKQSGKIIHVNFSAKSEERAA